MRNIRPDFTAAEGLAVQSAIDARLHWLYAARPRLEGLELSVNLVMSRNLEGARRKLLTEVYQEPEPEWEGAAPGELMEAHGK